MKPARIFIVEDEAVVMLDVQDRLAALGYEVTGMARSGEDALAQIEAHLPDLVLMDIRLQGMMDGIKTAEVIRQRWRLPVVYLTAYSEDNTIQRAKITEPFGYLIKPFEDREIKSVIEMAIYKHQAEQRLRESEQRYATTLRSIGDGVIATDPQGCATFLNPVAELLTGWPLAEAQGRPLREVFRVINEQTRQPVEDPVVRALREKKVVSLANHTILISRDGREIPIDDAAAPILDDKGAITGMVLVFQDVTERRHKERSLRQSEAQFRLVWENSKDGLRLLDSQGCMLRVNQAFCDLVGKSRDELEGQSLVEIYEAEPGRRILAQYVDRYARSTLEPYLERKVRLWNGQETWFAVSNSFLDPDTSDPRILSVFRDVTENKRAEEALRASEERYRQIVETAHEGIWSLDAQSRTSYVNRRMEQMLGYRAEEMLGRPLTDFLRPEDAANHAAQFEARRQGKPGHFERRYRHASGEWRWMSVSATPQLDQQGRFLGSFAMFTDITGRKHAEEERLEMERRLLHAQKLESLGVLAGGIAHDFNNLLTAILGNIELAMADVSELSPARDSLREASLATRRAADLTRQMLAYSGRGKFVIKELDISEMVEEMAHLLKVSISKTVTLHLQVMRALPRIRADVNQMQQIVMNLITNASEALGERVGSITITTGVQECDEATLASSRLTEKARPGRYVFLEVADTGCGMDESVQQRLFDPFFSTKFTGRGLGMAAVLGVVRGHQGAIMVSSQVGCGSTIRVLLPASAAECTAAAPNRSDLLAPPPPPAPTMRGTVLVVDDEAPIRKLVERLLTRIGLRVLCAADGEEAIRIFRAEADGVACVVLDLTMPKMDGMQTFAELHQIRADVPVFLASGFEEQELSRRFTGQGLAGFIQKPYQLDSLVQLIRQACAPRSSGDPESGKKPVP